MITFDRVRLAMLQGLLGALWVHVYWPDVDLLKLTVLLFLFQVIFMLIAVLVYVYWPDRWSWTWTKSEPEKAKNQ